ncbi:MAG TPA: chaperone modulator CbpM [Casimicrobiaceae bacterium]|nr:chaperone modulator CbpM [Casimicrobiaceae bacterium]
MESTSALVLDERGTLSVAQLVEQSGLTEAELHVLVDCGALAPRDLRASTWLFSTRCVVTARTARRLRDDFALDDVHAVAIMLRLRERIEALEQELRHLRSLR